MNRPSLLPLAAVTLGAVALLAGCTSTSTTTTPTGSSTPTAVNTPATPKESAAAAANDNKCVNDVAWMTFENGKPATRTLAGKCESVIVFGNKGHLTLDTAGAVTVMGDHNTVTVAFVGKVDFEGTGNTLTYKGAKPDVLESGTGNTLTAG